MDLNERDRRIIATIEELRERHHACTAAAVAAKLKISRTYMSEIMHDMIERELLTFEAEMPGSLRLTEATRAALFPPEADSGVTAVRDVCDEPGCDWPTPKAVAMHKRRAHT